MLISVDYSGSYVLQWLRLIGASCPLLLCHHKFRAVYKFITSIRVWNSGLQSDPKAFLPAI